MRYEMAMLRYLYHQVIFKEIPDEVTLGISISGCQIRCQGCHSRELWEDKGTPLTTQELDRLLDENKGITCLLLMGGEHDIGELLRLFLWVRLKSNIMIKTAWYCGLDCIPKDKLGILNYLNYVKLGHYDPELGGLDSKTTNQRLYKVGSYMGLTKLDDITDKFWHISV